MSELTLECKMRKVLGNITERLSQSEIENKEYGHFVFAQLSEQGILVGEYNVDNARAVGEIGTNLIEKLSSEKLTGIKTEYYMLKSTQLSEQASEDVNGYQTLIKNTVEHVRQTLDGEKANMKVISLFAQDYIESNTPELDPVRRGYLLGTMGDKLKQFETKVHPKIEQDKNQWIGNYKRHEIESALENL